MLLKLLQLNIFRGKYLVDVISFVKRNQIDILSLQEVSGGSISLNHQDDFIFLQNELSYQGVNAPSTTLENNHDSFFGNAILLKKSFEIQEQKTIWLKDFFTTQNFESSDFTQVPRNALVLKVSINGKILHLINTHLAWSVPPVDTKAKLEQAKKLYKYAKQIKEPFILGGDFNVPETSQIVGWFGSIAQNLTADHGITNTLNPKAHVAKHLFPKGLCVDFLFTKDIKAKNFRLLTEPTLSDHYGLYLEFEL